MTSYETSKKAVQAAYSNLFTTPNSANKERFMETSTAFIAEIKAKEAASTGKEDATRVAAAKAKAEEEARAAAVAEKARAEEAARAAAAAKADEEARAAAAAKANEDLKQQLQGEVAGLFQKFIDAFKDDPTNEAFLTFKQKYKNYQEPETHGTKPVLELQTLKTSLDRNGLIYNEFDKIYNEAFGTPFANSLSSFVGSNLQLRRRGQP